MSDLLTIIGCDVPQPGIGIIWGNPKPYETELFRKPRFGNIYLRALDAARFADLPHMLGAYWHAFQFPSYCGDNFQATIDCCRDKTRSIGDKPSLTIVWNCDLFLARVGDDGIRKWIGMILELFNDSLDVRADRGWANAGFYTAFHVSNVNNLDALTKVISTYVD